jgi:DNA topoisomerase-1
MIQTTQGEKINLIQAGMSGDGPFAPMVERMDREITSIIMGADLATMSRADGAGASLQGDETDDLIDGDCEWVSEVFQRRLDARVLEWHFGVGVEPLAFFKLSPPSNVDIEREMKVDDHVTKFGVKLSVADLAERYARSHDEAAEEIKPESEKKDEEQEPEQEKEDPAAGNAFDPDKHERDNLGRWAKKDVSDGAKATKGNKATRGEMREGTDEDYKRLKIPPRKIITDKDGKEKITGYADLQVTDDPESDVLGVALDPKGEAKPFYSANWEEKQAAIKWARLRELHKDMPEIKEQWDADIADPSSKNHQEALAMRLMYKSGLRIGGKDGGGKVESFGATSLKTEHVRVDGDKVHLDFTGKKGVRQQHTVTDPDLAKWATARQASGAERLFDTNDAKTRDYSNKIGGDKYRVHDLRDYNGTMLAQATVNKLRAKGVTMPDAGKAQDDYKMRVAKVVGRQLGNDPKMSLKAYISPAVWKDAEMTKKMPKPMRGSDGEPQKRKAA